MSDLTEICGPAEAAVRAVLDHPTSTNLDGIAHEIVHAATVSLRPAHYREAAASLRKIADTMRVGSSFVPAHMNGIEHAARLLESTARDIEGDTE